MQMYGPRSQISGTRPAQWRNLKAHFQLTGFPTVCFCYGNAHCLSQRSDWMNFSFGWIFMYESCSTARKACGLKFKFDISQTWFFFLNEGKPVSPLEGADLKTCVNASPS